MHKTCYDENGNRIEQKLGVLPGAPSNPWPHNAASEACRNVELSWSPRQDSTSYDLYLWREDDLRPAVPTAGGLTTPSFQPTQLLDVWETYDWQVVAKNLDGATDGPVWSFTTTYWPPPQPATDPNPADGAADVQTSVELSWWTPSLPDGCDLYLWRDGEAPPDTPTAADIGWYDVTFKPPQPLAEGTVYRWQIVAKDNNCATTGSVWTFTAVGAPALDIPFLNVPPADQPAPVCCAGGPALVAVNMVVMVLWLRRNQQRRGRG